MAGLVKLGVDAKSCSDEDLVTLAVDNDSLREQAVSLLLEIEALRETLEAQSTGFQVLGYWAWLGRK